MGVGLAGVADRAALVVVGVETVQLRARDDCVGLVQDERSRLEIVEEALVTGIDHVFVGLVRAIGPAPAAVLDVGGREQIVAFISVGFRPIGIVVGDFPVGADRITKRITGLSKIYAGKDGEGVLHVRILEHEQFAIELGGEGIAVGRVQVIGGLCIAWHGIRNAQQIIAGGVGQVGHGRFRTAQNQGQGGLNGDARQGSGIGETGLQNGSIENAILHDVVIRIAIFPIALGIEM